jgi:hypothetical protein
MNKNNTICKFLFLLLSAVIILSDSSLAQNKTVEEMAIPYTQGDRDRSIRMEARLDAMDKRFEQVDKRFEEAHTYTGWTIALFGAMFAATIGFAMWDRRTMVRPFETKVALMDLEIAELKINSQSGKIIIALRELSKSDTKLAEILRNNNLL